MSESILIDGHNAMHRLGVAEGDQQARRSEFVQRVARFAPRATVYFDGRPDLRRPNHGGEGDPRPDERDRERGISRSRLHGLWVVHCNHREADAEIVAEVRGASDPGRLLIVSDDREVTGRCRQLGARTSGVRAFFSREQPAAPSGRDGRRRRSPAAILRAAVEQADAGKPPRRKARETRLTAADFGLPDEVDLGDPPPLD